MRASLALVIVAMAATAIAAEDDLFAMSSPEFELEQDMPQDKLLRIAEAAATTAVEVDAAPLKKKPVKKGAKYAKKFKKLEPKMVKYCEVETKLHSTKGRCRAYRRFCNLWKKFGLPKYAKPHCDKMKAAHAKMVKANKPKKKSLHTGLHEQLKKAIKRVKISAEKAAAAAKAKSQSNKAQAAKHKAVGAARLGAGKAAKAAKAAGKAAKAAAGVKKKG